MIVRKSAEEIETMARAGRVVAETLAAIGEAIRPGVTTLELDELAEDRSPLGGGVPTFKGYNGFPGSSARRRTRWSSTGSPVRTQVVEGDVMSIDVGVTLDGFVRGLRAAFGVGEIHAEAQRLLDVCEAALAAGISGPAGRSRRRHPPRPCSESPRTRASRSCARWSATASAARCTEQPEVPNFGEPATARNCPPG